jgi:branched-chain amino acid transport system substrate-binding protein
MERHDRIWSLTPQDNEGVNMKRLGSRAGLILAAVTIAVVALAATAAARTTSSKASPIVIGWAYDSTGAMAPFDGPALAAAQLRVKQVNARGGVGGRPLQIKTCNTQGNKPAVAKACALKLLGGGANIIFTTCDVDFAAPVVQETINRGVLAVAPCIGTDQMGPKRFGPKGKLAFSFGNVAQDEGSAMAQYAWGKGWRSASLATDSVIVYFKNVVQAFKARWQQLGGKIVDEETYQDPTFGGNNVQNAVSRLNDKKADVIVTSTAGAYGALAPFITGLRTLGNNTPILNSWAGDGTYWLPKSPKVTNYYFVTFASSFGNDPNPAINKLAKQVHAATGGFVTGPAAIDGVVTAINRSHGSTTGAVLAATMQKFHKVPTLSGLVSFSPTLHTVFGRQYRVIKIQNNVPKVVGTVVAKVVPKI